MALPDSPALIPPGEPGSLPPTVDQNKVYVIDPLFAGQGTIFIVSPTTAVGRVAVIPVSDIARDQASIMIEYITQTYFRDNIKKFIPYEYWRLDAKPTTDGGGDGALNAYTQVFAITMDEVKQAIDQLPLIFDIEHCPPRYLRVIAEMLNFPLEDVDTTAEQRRQLKTAIQWYQSKGSRRAFTAILYSFGFYATMVPLWTEDYEVFTDTIPGVAKGNDPPNDHPLLIENGGTWYRSPHYGIQLIGIVEDKHVFIEWGDATQQQKDDFELRAEEIGYHRTWYEMVDELCAAGALLRYHFSAEDFAYIYRRLEFLRPVFAVLDWLQFLTEMQEEVEVPEAAEPMMTANPIRDEKGWYLGYCDQNDIQYTRLDQRLLGLNYLDLDSPLTGGLPGSTTIVDEVTYTVSGSPSHISGTLVNSWLWPGVTLTLTINAGSVDAIDAQETDIFHWESVDVSDEVIATGDGIETDFAVKLEENPVVIDGLLNVSADLGSGSEVVELASDDDGVISGDSSAGEVTGFIYEVTGDLALIFPVPPTGDISVNYSYWITVYGEIVIPRNDTNGATKIFSGKLEQTPLTEGTMIWVKVDYGIGIEKVTITDSTGTFTGTGISGTINYSTGVWGVTFTTAPAADTEVLLMYAYPRYEGVLAAEGVLGVLDYSTGFWWLDFETGYEPDDATNVLADYVYTSEVPPTDRSGEFPRGSSELPFPHVRDPQEGYCHPPEELDIEWTWLPEEQYTLALIRNGMNLYPPAGPIPYIDHADFPSRGFTSDGNPGHANTFTRQYGYSTRPLSLLRVEANPDDSAENWENQSTPWENWTGPWETIGD